MTEKNEKKIRKKEKVVEKTQPIKKEKLEKAIEIEGKKKVEVLKEIEKETNGKTPLYVYLILILIVAFAIGFLLYYISFTPISFITGNPVKEGDTIKIAYTAKYQNGSVFSEGNFTFKVGSNEVIEGVDEAVRGMKIGESKTVVIPPEKAYGNYDPSNIIDIPLEQELNRTESLSIEQFNLTFGKEPKINEIYKLEDMKWPLRVISIENNTVMLRHEPEDGFEFELTDVLGNIYGRAKVAVLEDKLKIKMNPIVGSYIYTFIGGGKIIDANETSMKIDFNHELAGKTLIFEIKILNLIPS